METEPTPLEAQAPAEETASPESIHEAMRLLETNGPDAPAPEVEAAPSASAGDESDESEPAAEPEAEPEADDDGAVVEGDGPKAAPRFRINPKRYEGRRAELEVIRLIDQEGYTVADAVAKVHGTAPAAQTGEVPAPEKTGAPAAEGAPTEESLQAEIDDLETQATKAAEEEFDLGKVRKLDKQIAAKQREIEALKGRKESEQKNAAQTVEEKHRTAEHESFATLAQQYPQLTEDDNEFVRAVQEEVDFVESFSPGFQSRDPRWLEPIAAKVAKRLNSSSTSVAASAPASPKSGPVPAVSKPTVPARGVPPAAVAKPPVKSTTPPPGPAPVAASPAPATHPSTPVGTADVWAAMREAEKLAPKQRHAA